MAVFADAPSTLLSVRWDAFLSGLAVAEKAAARHFELIADGLRAEGRCQLARRYERLACEEHEHFERVSRSYRVYIPPAADTMQFYDGVPDTVDAPLVERMAVAHFAHETAALAFLGQIYGHVQEHMKSAAWALDLRRLCAGILCEEVKHVNDGKNFVSDCLRGQDQVTKNRVSSAVRLHRIFVIRATRRVFEDDRDHPFVQKMIADFDRRCRTATAGIL